MRCRPAWVWGGRRRSGPSAKACAPNFPSFISEARDWLWVGVGVLAGTSSAGTSAGAGAGAVRCLSVELKLLFPLSSNIRGLPGSRCATWRWVAVKGGRGLRTECIRARR